MAHMFPFLDNEVSLTFRNFLILSAKTRGCRILHFGVDSDCLALDLLAIPHLEIPSDRKEGPHASYFPLFGKRGFCNSSKLSSSCQQRPEASNSCCLALEKVIRRCNVQCRVDVLENLRSIPLRHCNASNVLKAQEDLVDLNVYTRVHIHMHKSHYVPVGRL